MNVNELRQLAEWFISNYPKLSSLYGNLIGPIQHNASQPNKQPVEGQLELLIAFLNEMNFEELSLQQLKMLANFGVDKYIGAFGASFVSSVVRTSNFDPATAAGKISEASNKINEAQSGFSAYLAALKSLAIIERVDGSDGKTIIIRVGFQNEASIDNVTDWKESAKEWHDIIRGLALACDEAPEDTKVVGASTGSIILILAGTYPVTRLLALISKHIASVAKDIVEISNQIEDLRHKKILNKVIETEFKNIQKEKKDKALREIVDDIKKETSTLDGEKITGLEGSIKKLLSFNEKGGNVDFVAPETETDDLHSPADDKGIISALGEARTEIREYQNVREQLKLLTGNTPKT